MPNKTVYTRKGEPVVMRQLSEHLFEKLDADGEPTGDIVNLPVALECCAYFETPIQTKKGDKHNGKSKP